MDISNPEFFVERRKFRRFNIPLNILFKSADDTASYSSGKIRNFSRYGFCFESEKTPVRADESLEFIVRHPKKETYIPIKGAVVWVRKDDNRILAGIKINEIDRAAKSEILDYGYDTWLEETRQNRFNSELCNT